MIIQNVKVYNKNHEFVDGEILIRNGKFEEINQVPRPDLEKSAEEDTILDGEGCYAIPGLIDLHFHGCKGYDFCDGTKEAIAEIAKYEASVGVTAISPATMTLPINELEAILSTAADYKKDMEKEPSGGADLVGINMEGPFISEAKKGAQDQLGLVQSSIRPSKNI